MRLRQSYGGPEAQRFALEPPPHGADWPEVAYEVEVIFVYEKKPTNAEKNQVGRKCIRSRGPPRA